jgi:hypothetical protein
MPLVAADCSGAVYKSSTKRGAGCSVTSSHEPNTRRRDGSSGGSHNGSHGCCHVDVFDVIHMLTNCYGHNRTASYMGDAPDVKFGDESRRSLPGLLILDKQFKSSQLKVI